MHVVRRGDSALLLDVDLGEFVDYDFEIVVPLERGGEVLMGRTVSLFLSEVGVAADGELRVAYSHDFGGTFADRGTLDVLPAGGVFFSTFEAIGTNIRFTVTPDPLAVGLFIILDSEMHLR